MSGLFCYISVLKTNPSENLPARYYDGNQSSGTDPKESVEIHQFVPAAGLTLDLYSRASALRTTSKHSIYGVT